MANHTFDIKDIHFEDPTGMGNDLEYPIYPDLIKYNGVESKIFQLEPAFQFLNLDKGHSYTFNLHLRSGIGIVFSNIPGHPGYFFATPTPPFVVPEIKVVMRGPTHCQVTVTNTAGWGMPGRPKLFTLRILCSKTATANVSNSNHGISISFMKPDGTLSRRPPCSIEPMKPELTIGVDIVPGPMGIPVPKYDSIYTYDGEPFNKDLTLEPAFRLSQKRPDARVGIAVNGPHHFNRDTSTDDDVNVYERTPIRPVNLSKVHCEQIEWKLVNFRYAFEMPNYPSQAGAYSFYLKVASGLILGAVANQGGDFAHVDPIMMHDPPPASIP